MPAWERFVLEHGRKARAHELAAVLDVPLDQIEAVRQTRSCRRTGRVKRFAELFTLWHGRPPRDDEWPRPRKNGGGRTYEWQAPELALLATMVGRLDSRQIARVLTRRLRERTGDRRALRTRWSVLIAQQRIGMQSSDFVGGISLTDAGREIGAYAVVFQAIERKHLRAFRVGKRWVIPRDAWEKWKAAHVFPPKGYVQLSSVRKSMAIRSDKLSEFARAGHIPTAIRCNPYGARLKLTKFGTWFISREVARKLVADRHAGRPMPWHGQPELGNLRVTFRLWQERKHPPACATCRQIWGRKGPPASFDEYVERYHPLAHGAKRHLTRKWSPGLTVKEVAKLTGHSWGGVHNAVENGMLVADVVGRTRYISRTELARWRGRGCLMGGSQKSWLALSTASSMYGFTRAELRAFIRQGRLRSRIGTHGAMRGITYVQRHQLRVLRERMGFSEEEAARKAGVTLARFRRLLAGVNWRGARGIPLETVQAVIKRLESREGYTVEDAAEVLGSTETWIHERIKDGTIRVARAKWDARRLYISEPMMARLRKAKRIPPKRENFSSSWLFLGQAAAEAGVSLALLNAWGIAGEIRRRHSHLGWRYARKSVRARAREYWRKPRLKRATPPAWLLRERARPAANEASYNHLRMVA